MAQKMAEKKERFGWFAQGPPDLDEWLRQTAERLRRTFGGGGSKRGNPWGAFQESRDNGGGGGGDGGPSRPRELPMNPKIIISLAASAIVLIYLVVGFYTVDASERAILFRLGNPVAVTEPGLRWHLPLVEDYRIINISNVRRSEIGYRDNPKNKIPRESLMLTDNLNIIDIQFAVQFLLKDPEDYLFENRSPEEAVAQVAETAMREIVGRSKIDFVLYEGREEIAAEAKLLMQGILDRYRTGIQVQQVAVQNVQPPDQVQDAFEDAIKARQDHERKINEGQAYANNVIPRARGMAARIEQEAEGYRRAVIAESEGETERFTRLADEYIKAPEVTRRRLYLEVIEKVFANSSKILIDQKEGSNNLIYLPLDRLIGGGGASSSASPLSGGEGGGRQPLSAGGSLPTLEEVKDRLRRELGGGQSQIEKEVR